MTEHETRLQQWQALMTMSEELHQLALQGEWDRFTELMHTRRQQLETFFATPVPSELQETVAEGIHAMLAMDQASSGLAEKARDEVKSEVLKLTRGQKQVKQYQQRF